MLYSNSLFKKTKKQQNQKTNSLFKRGLWFGPLWDELFASSHCFSTLNLPVAYSSFLVI